jgi:translation elongation factor EF-Ts
MHMGGKISVIVKMSAGTSDELAHDIAMQVASMSPTFISRKDIAPDYIEHERNIQREIIKNDEALAGKPEKVREGILEGRLSKSLQESCMVDQLFFKNQDVKVSDVLKAEKPRFSPSCVMRSVKASKKKKRISQRKSIAYSVISFTVEGHGTCPFSTKQGGRPCINAYY